MSGVRLASTPGMPCPRCGARIVVEVADLLARMGVKCPACGLELRLNHEQSAETLGALRNFVADNPDTFARRDDNRARAPSRRPRRR